MNLTSKMIGYGLLLFIAFGMLSPVIVYGSVDHSLDHTYHSQGATSAAMQNQTKIDCASACVQNSRAENPVFILKEFKQKKEKQPQTEPEVRIESRQKSRPSDRIVPKSCILPVQEIYKFTCVYLL